MLAARSSAAAAASDAATNGALVNGTAGPNPWVIMKFGGTSVGTAERMSQVAEIIKDTAASRRPVAVLSAMSSYKKSEGTTSRLLDSTTLLLPPNPPRSWSHLVEAIERDHLAAVRGGVSEPEEREKCEEMVKAELARLRGFLEAAETIGEITPRSRDIVISAGEKLSALIFTSVLRSRGVPALYVNLERVVDKQFGDGNGGGVDQGFYDYVAKRLGDLVRVVEEGCVPVLTGYLGPVPGSILTTIGRGYTDLTAALCAVGIGAEELQIWKEVDGIFTADPRKVPLARLLPYISPEEAAELTYYGSEVIHPFTMEQVIRASIPIRIKNTFHPAGRGTVVLPGPDSEARAAALEECFSAPHVGPDGSPLPTHRPSRRHATAVTIKDNVTVLNVHSNRKSVSHGFFAHIFRTLDRHGIVVDLISTSEVHVSMALGPNVKEANLKGALSDLKRLGTVDVIADMAILSLVGRLMRHMVGIAGRMFSVLAQHNVNIEMISQGASEINISCVIEQNRAAEALKAVHDACVLAIGYEDGLDEVDVETTV
ncbi:aspartate kinase [Gonapodya prolifera JEL478]|uniref:Aspartokinase n=1 Tax=Gonapodya prolifera (strain JEL478) TaxID=1344416 RepID=A0A139AU13_GONPJ|nr:aspartate kinase [Gonapodya prolifera JEL478]|eukprot:KXS20230.1 aspartate kinase [Gonapodya prolifera JEL478]